LAKTIDREKHSTARARTAASTRDVARPHGDATDEVVNESVDDEFAQLDDADESQPTSAEADEMDEDLALAPAERPAAPVVGRSERSDIQVPSWMLQNGLTRELALSYIELRKVTWPSRQDAWNMTLVVIAFSAVVAAILSAADFGLSHLLTYLVNLGLGH